MNEIPNSKKTNLKQSTRSRVGTNGLQQNKQGGAKILEIWEKKLQLQHFFISTLDPWYGDIIVYLQTLKVPTHLSRDER